jgi:hypothetical protein
MAFTPEQVLQTISTALPRGNGGSITFGYRPESGPEDSRTPARWECTAQMGGRMGRDSREYAAVGASLEDALDKLLESMNAETGMRQF